MKNGYFYHIPSPKTILYPPITRNIALNPTKTIGYKSGGVAPNLEVTTVMRCPFNVKAAIVFKIKILNFSWITCCYSMVNNLIFKNLYLKDYIIYCIRS